MSTTAYIAKTICTARDAIASHIRWKITLCLAARLREPLSQRATHSIQHPEQCSIHRWLLSKHTLQLRDTPEYRAVLECHIAFHREMLHIADLLHAGHFDQAEALLNSPGPFTDASNSLANALMALDRPAVQRQRPETNTC